MNKKNPFFKHTPLKDYTPMQLLDNKDENGKAILSPGLHLFFIRKAHSNLLRQKNLKK